MGRIPRPGKSAAVGVDFGIAKTQNSEIMKLGFLQSLNEASVKLDEAFAF